MMSKISTEDPPKALKLSDQERDNLNLLYLAKYAPSIDQQEPTKSEKFSSFSKYHFDLFETLQRLNLKVTPMASIKDSLNVITNFNYIFSVQNSEPFRNSEVLIASIAECYDIGYLGAPPNVRALAEDKYLCNSFMRSIGINVPESQILTKYKSKGKVPPFPGPFLIKPRFGVNSEFMSQDCVQDLWKDLDVIWSELKDLGIDAVVEKFIPGENYGAPFVEGIPPNQTSVLFEVNVGDMNVLTSKHKENSTVFNQRSTIKTGLIADQLQGSNAQIREEIGVCDYFRTDWRIHSETYEPYLLELNVCCSVGRSSGIALACYEWGWSYEDTLEHIITKSVRREPSPR